MRIFFLSLILVVVTTTGLSQRSHFGSWNVINTKVTFNDHWSIYNELQLRSQSFYHDHYYYEVKGGVGYALSKNFSFLIGGGKYITYSDDGNFVKPVSANETRLWEQLTMNQYVGSLKFEHRYRVEQRWFKTGYRNRFRYRLNTVLPLNHQKIGPKTIYISAFDEIFLTNKAPYFERNRFFTGVGYQFTKLFSIQPGYVYQYDYRSGIGFGKHFFQLTLTFDIDASKSQHEKIPGNLD